MVFIVRDTLSEARPQADGKLIPAGTFWAWRQVRTVLEDAERDAAQIRARALEGQAEAVQRGHAEGLALARREQAEVLARFAAETHRYHRQAEARMVELVLAAVHEVVAGIDATRQVRSVVQRALALVRGEKLLTLRVHPSHVAALKDDVASLLAPHPTVEYLDIVGDARVAIDACRIESEIGVVETSISALLDALDASFREVGDASA